MRALLLAALLLQGCASILPVPAGGVASDVARLTRQADEWDRAIVRKDLPAIAANVAEDFRMIDGGAAMSNREEFLRDIAAPELTIDPYVVEDFDVRVYGDVALLSGRARMSGRESGKDFKVHYRYVDVYVRRSGEWKVVSIQITRMP